jgi:hypothetical protein
MANARNRQKTRSLAALGSAPSMAERLALLRIKSGADATGMNIRCRMAEKWAVAHNF